VPRRFLALASSAAALALTLLGGAPARAQSKPDAAGSGAGSTGGSLEIRWRGPEDCERGDAVRAKVLRLLGSSRRPLGERFEVQVTVRREAPSRYVAELETVTATGSGSKRLEGESCDAIALASSVVIALSIDPEASLDAQEPEEQPPPSPTPKPPAQPRRAMPVVREPRATSPYLHGSVGVLFGLLNDPSAFSSFGLGVRHHLVSVELAGALYQAREVFRADRPRVGAELRLLSAELLGCYAPLRSRLASLETCAGGRFEYLTATAFGVSHPDEGELLLLSGLGVLRGRLRATSWLSATLDLGAAARAFHPTFVLIGVGDVYDIPIISPFARTGLSLEF
jgi:hypothetical protein